jgi:hypothetical protein
MARLGSRSSLFSSDAARKPDTPVGRVLFGEKGVQENCSPAHAGWRLKSSMLHATDAREIRFRRVGRRPFAVGEGSSD